MCPMKKEFEKFLLRQVTFALLLAGSAQLSLARPPSQPAFPSPEQASRALFSAVKRHDERAVTKILGAGSELVGSDDRVEDALDRERFVQKYQEMHRVVREPAGLTVLYIGAENWPFPVPLVSDNGMWRFDADSGAREIQFRRIGENEVTAIGVCHALVTAQAHPGKDNGADHLVDMVFTRAQDGSDAVPFHGYNFRILSKSNKGFAAIAYPIVYRTSGVMTFIVNQNDDVFERDLGPNTAAVARAMTAYQVDLTWSPVESEGER
jgi:Protein of unknown function (DUF2950)